MNEKNIECNQCGKFFNKYGINIHIFRVHTEKGINLKPKLGKLGKSWNKGLTKETSDIIRRTVDSYKKGLFDGKFLPSQLGKYQTQEVKDKISLGRIAYLEKNGVCKNNGKRGHKGWYEGYWCDSSYGLAFIIYNLEHDVKFERNTEGFRYFFENKNKLFFPDFIIDGVYFEIKGRDSFDKLDLINQEKIKQFKYPLKVLYNQDTKVYLEYAREKYGKDFIRLYDGYVKPIKIEKEKVVRVRKVKILKVKKEKIKKEMVGNLTKFEYNRLKKIEDRKELILNCDIDFNIYGWVVKLSNLLNISEHKSGFFVRKYMSDFYQEKCFSRKCN